MKKLILLSALVPSMAAAHGAHVPVSDAAHGMAHAGLNAGLAVIALAVIVALVRRFRS